MSFPNGLSHRLTDMKLYHSSTCDYVTLKHLLWQNKEILSVWWLRYIKEGLAQAAFSQKVETAVVILEMKHAEELLNHNYRSSPEPFFFANIIIKPPKKLRATDGQTTCLEPGSEAAGASHSASACSSSRWNVLLAGCQEHCWEPLYIFNTYRNMGVEEDHPLSYMAHFWFLWDVLCLHSQQDFFGPFKACHSIEEN